MTPFEQCILIAWQCDYRGEKYDGYPVLVELDNLSEFLSMELGIYQFRHSDILMVPEDWPVTEYPTCLCGHGCLGDDHFILQLGDGEDQDIEDLYWPEWSISLHKTCMPGFFELITGGKFIEDKEEWLGNRDDPCWI